MVLTGISSPSKRYLVWFLLVQVILYQSFTSCPTLVTPQATSSLNPIIIPGIPAKDTPILLTLGVCIWSIYQMEGKVKDRCGSLQRMGFPLFVFLPETAQLLEPMPGCDLVKGMAVVKAESILVICLAARRTFKESHCPKSGTTGFCLGLYSG